MAVTSEGTILSVYQDNCMNYDPDRSKPMNVMSVKLGMIFECNKYDHGDNPNQGCYWCKNKI